MWVRRVPLLLINYLTVLRSYRLIPSLYIRYICNVSTNLECILFADDSNIFGSGSSLKDVLTLYLIKWLWSMNG